MAATPRVEAEPGQGQSHAAPNRDGAGGRTQCTCGEGPARVWRPAQPGDVSPVVPDCARPFRLVCTGCQHVLVMACERGDEVACPTCSERYRKRVQVVAREPAAAVGPGRVMFVTATAPGTREHRKPGGELCRCTPAGGVDLARWNAQLGKRWNRWQQQLRRQFGQRGYQLRMFKATEPQSRGAYHVHALIVLDRPWDGGTKQLQSELRELAIDFGFGHQLDVQLAGSSSRSAQLLAWYVSKYVTKSVTERRAMPWHVDVGPHCSVDEATGEVVEHRGDPRSTRAWTSSRDWGLNMARVVEAQRLWQRLQVISGTLLAPPDEQPIYVDGVPGQVQLARAGP
jgi:hypothetical protein